MKTNYHDHVPIHRLNQPQTVLWLFGGEVKRRMASNLAKRYPAGVGIVSATLYLIAYVDPRGGFRDLPPPHKRYVMPEISNRPMVGECQCAGFFDPEVGGPWRERGTDEHHPMCQFDRVAGIVYKQAMQQGEREKLAGLDADENPIFKKSEVTRGLRPDEWMRMRSEARLRTGATR